MKSEIENNGKPPAAEPPEEEKTGEKEEKTEEPEEEKTGGETKPSGGAGIIMYAVLLIGAVGAGWFLIGLVRRRRAPPVDKSAEVERINQRVPAFPGF